MISHSGCDTKSEGSLWIMWPHASFAKRMRASRSGEITQTMSGDSSTMSCFGEVGWSWVRPERDETPVRGTTNQAPLSILDSPCTP